MLDQVHCILAPLLHQYREDSNSTDRFGADRDQNRPRFLGGRRQLSSMQRRRESDCQIHRSRLGGDQSRFPVYHGPHMSLTTASPDYDMIHPLALNHRCINNPRPSVHDVASTRAY